MSTPIPDPRVPWLSISPVPQAIKLIDGQNGIFQLTPAQDAKEYFDVQVAYAGQLWVNGQLIDPPDRDLVDSGTNTYVQVSDENKQPLAGIIVAQARVDGSAIASTRFNGQTDFYKAGPDAHGQGGSSFDPGKSQTGPYFYFVYDTHKSLPSKVVYGCGLPLRRHNNEIIAFQRVLAAGTPIPPIPPVPVPPVPPPVAQTLEQAALAVAHSVVWMPINNGAALWKFAQANGLQDQQTDELKFMYGGVPYICQVFNLGIVYCRVGDYGSISVIKK